VRPAGGLHGHPGQPAFKLTGPPTGWTGKHPGGLPPSSSANTFLPIRPWYVGDPQWPKVQAYLNGGSGPVFSCHRFWAEVDIATAFESFAQLFPAAQPPSGFWRSRQYSSSELDNGRARARECRVRARWRLEMQPRGGPAGRRVPLVLPPGLRCGQAGDPPDVDGHPDLRGSTSSPRCDRPARRAGGKLPGPRQHAGGTGKMKLSRARRTAAETGL
jgi:hypothetical protein